MPALGTAPGRTESIGRALAAAAGLIPTFLLTSGIISLPTAVAGLVQVMGFGISMILVIALVLLSERIARVRRSASAIAIGVALAGSVVLGLGYWQFAETHLLTVQVGEQRRDYVLPIDPSPEARAIAAQYGGDYRQALQASLQSERLGQLLDQAGGGSLALMAALLLAAQGLLTLSLAGGALRLAMSSDPTTGPNDDDEMPPHGGSSSGRQPPRPVPGR